MADNCKEGSKKRFTIHRPRKSILLRKMDERECGIEEKQISVSFMCMAFMSVSDMLFATNAALGKINWMPCLSGTRNFLNHMGIHYDSFWYNT